MANIRIWSSDIYARIDSPESKLAPRAKKGILIGYKSNQYLVLNPLINNTFWSRDVLVDERSVFSKRDSFMQDRGSLECEDDTSTIILQRTPDPAPFTQILQKIDESDKDTISQDNNSFNFENEDNVSMPKISDI